MVKTKKISVLVPIDFQLPTVFHDSSPEINSSILELGGKAYMYIQNEGVRMENDKLFEKLKSDASKEYTDKLEHLEHLLEHAKNTAIKQENDFQTTIQSLRSRLQMEQGAFQDLEKRVREEERRNRNDLLAEKDKQIGLLREQLQTSLRDVEKSLKESQRSFQDNLYSFKEQILKTNSTSKKKGEQGETVFEDILQRAFGSVSKDEVFDVKNVGREGHQGDICMIWRNHKIMWEVKNYERNVEQKEVSKFLRDMEEGQEFSLGVMVSMTSGIVGHAKAGNIDIQELRDGRICIYLSHFMTANQDTVLYLQSLRPFFETLIEHRQNSAHGGGEEMTVKDITERFENHRAVMIKLLKKHEESMRKFRNMIMNAKKKSEQIWLDLGVEMREAENSVKLLLDTMLEIPEELTENSAIAENGTENSAIRLPGYVFRHSDIQLYSAKDQKCIVQLLELLEFGEDFIMLKKDLKDALKERGIPEEASGRMLEQILREESWEKGKQRVKCMRFKNT
jgi:hypothetical protein